MDTKKLLIIKIIGYGLLQWIILSATMFVLSLIIGVVEGAEMGAPPPLGFVTIAITMVIVSYFITRRLKPINRRQTILWGVCWSMMTLLFMLVTTIANGTQNNIFGNWGAYFMFVAQIIGAGLVTINRTILTTNV